MPACLPGHQHFMHHFLQSWAVCQAPDWLALNRRQPTGILQGQGPVKRLHTWWMALPFWLVVLVLAAILLFSQTHSVRFQSGAPPCVASRRPSGLKAMLTMSCRQAGDTGSLAGSPSQADSAVPSLGLLTGSIAKALGF